jgi:hypothetical protein
MYATGVGLILFRLHSVMPMQQQTADGFSPQATSKIIETMRRWFKRIRRGKQE